MINPTSTSSTPKLRDYMNAKKAAKDKNISSMQSNTNAVYNTSNTQQFIPPVRPNPLGSENPTQAVCSSVSTYYPPTSGAMPPTVGPNEPPPPYTQYYDTTGAGYTNPMFLQYQENIAPPAYKPQASPNSQFTALNANMSNMTLQQQHSANVSTAPHQMSSLPPSIGNVNQTGYNSLTNNPLTYQSNNQNYLAPNQQNYNINQQQYINSTAVNNNPTNPYPSSAFPAANMPANSLHSAQSTVSNAPQMYTQAVVTTASNTYTPQPQSYYYGSTNATLSANNLNTNYQTNSQQNNFQIPTSVPTNQPLYVSTNQPGLPSSTTLLQSTQNTTNIPSTMQAPYAVNNLQNQANVVQTTQTATVFSQNPLQIVNNTTAYPQVSPAISSAAIYSSVVTTTITSASSTSEPLSSYSTMHPGYSYDPQTGGYSYNSGYQQTSTANLQFYGQYTTGAAATNTQVGTTDSQSAGKLNLATGFDVSTT